MFSSYSFQQKICQTDKFSPLWFCASTIVVTQHAETTKRGMSWPKKKKKKKLTRAVCVQVCILGSSRGVCRGAKLWLWNARALHKLCFPQWGWEQKAHADTHADTYTSIKRRRQHTQTHTHSIGRWWRTRKREVTGTRQKEGGDRELMNLEQHTNKMTTSCRLFYEALFDKAQAWVNMAHGQSGNGRKRNQHHPHITSAHWRNLKIPPYTVFPGQHLPHNTEKRSRKDAPNG